MHLDHDHIGGHTHDHEHTHEHAHDCSTGCSGCAAPCEHTPMEELLALMKYMVGHNASHIREMANLAKQLEEAGEHTAFEQVMLAVSDYEKGNLRIQAVLSSLDAK